MFLTCLHAKFPRANTFMDAFLGNFPKFTNKSKYTTKLAVNAQLFYNYFLSIFSNCNC